MTSLAALRKEKKLTIKQMAEVLGCSQSKAWNAENGLALLNVNELANLGKKFGGSVVMEIVEAQKLVGKYGPN